MTDIHIDLYWKPKTTISYIHLSCVITMTSVTFEELMIEGPRRTYEDPHDDHVRTHSIRRRYEMLWEKALSEVRH